MLRLRDEYRSGLDGFLQQQNAQLESLLGQQRGGLEISVNKLRAAFDHEAERRVVMHSQWDDAFGKLQQTQKTVAALVETGRSGAGAGTPWRTAAARCA